MLIRMEDMDPKVVEAVMAGIHAALSRPDPSPEALRMQREDAQRFQPSVRGILPWLAGGFAPGIAASVLVTTGLIALPLALPLAIFAGLGVVGVGVARVIRSYVLAARVLHSDLLAGFLPLIELTPIHRAYCETLVLLAKPDLQVDDATARSFLGQLNELLESSRHLDTQRGTLVGLTATSSVETIERDRQRIMHQLAETIDANARASLEGSLHLCEGRLEAAKSLAPALERLDAQQEMILQTLGSVQANLTRLEAAHQALAPPDVDAIREQIRSLSEQAKAEESAVEEVLRIEG